MKLAEVLKQAKAAEVPKDIIERNLKKASDKSQADYQEVLALLVLLLVSLTHFLPTSSLTTGSSSSI